jgi:hypothetical protein
MDTTAFRATGDVQPYTGRSPAFNDLPMRGSAAFHRRKIGRGGLSSPLGQELPRKVGEHGPQRLAHLIVGEVVGGVAVLGEALPDLGQDLRVVPGRGSLVPALAPSARRVIGG